MKTLYDMMLDAQSGAIAGNLARQFGISERQALYAVEALMPAFSASLTRNTASPDGLAGFMGALMSGRHLQYYEDPGAAFGFGRDDGMGILGNMFGSKEVSRAVAAQAAQATGIGQEIIKQMLPVIASMVMGGLFKQATNYGGTSSGGGLLGDFIENMIGGAMGQLGGSTRRTSSRGRSFTAPNPFEDIMDEILKGAVRSRKSAPGRAASPTGGSGNPFEDIMEDALRNTRRRTPEKQTDRASTSRNKTAPAGKDVFGPMFEAGREIQSGYHKSMEDLMDQYLSGMRGA